MEPSVRSLLRWLPDPLVDIQVIEAEYSLWCSRWKRAGVQACAEIDCVLKALGMVDRMFLPNIYALLVIYATLPVSTATVERSFSMLRAIKTYTRSTMTENRLNHVCVLFAHREEYNSLEKQNELFRCISLRLID
jgi:hypothetical protein